jgi:GDP-mannose 6-dehydrogenase
MRISIFGLGYVGSVSAACFAREGHEVVGVDVNPDKVAAINAGTSPVIEAELPDLIRRGVAEGRLRATADAREAVLATDLSFVCVGTPSLPNGSLDLTAVTRTCESIGAALRAKSGPHTVAVRSTMLPGSARGVVIPALSAASGRGLGPELHVCVNPEFLREGTSVADFYDPPFVLIGDADAERTGAAQVAAVCASIPAPVFVETLETAEMVKYACNAFHALKVAFANEMGGIAAALGCDSQRVMHLLCQDTKLNISAKYLRPGFAFGGSCLPKDVRALVHRAHAGDLQAPLLSALLPSNRDQIDRAVALIMRLAAESRRVGFLGFSFKAGTDDLRESPLVTLIETLLGKGYSVTVYDRNVSLARLVGANRRYIEQEIPHIAALMRASAAEVVAAADVLVVGNADPEFASVVAGLGAEKTVLDLVRVVNTPAALAAQYYGINW